MAATVDEHDRAMTKQNNETNEKDCSSSGTKVKRKSRSARRRLNAMRSNASLHFSDTDSEGELTMINSKIDKLNPVQASSLDNQRRPLISVTDTEDVVSGEIKINNNLDYLIADGEVKSRRNSFVENLTDVDEIYSDGETEERNLSTRHRLNVNESDYQGETDLEDMEGDDDIQPTIYVALRSDILTDFNGEMITTKEGDGPFSVEVRNRLSLEQVSIERDTEGIPNMPSTDSEDMEASEDERLDEAACGTAYEDFDFLDISQIVVSNKTENNVLHVPDTVDDAIGDCHTDVEDVDD